MKRFNITRLERTIDEVVFDVILYENILNSDKNTREFEGKYYQLVSFMPKENNTVVYRLFTKKVEHYLLFETIYINEKRFKTKREMLPHEMDYLIEKTGRQVEKVE